MKPLTLEEAEANIGKEVIYIGTDEYVKRNERKYSFYLKRIESFDCVTNIRHIAVVAMGGIGRVCRLPIEHIALKQPLKIGDTVKLDPSTKPYTVTNWKGKVVERTGFDEDSEEHTIMSIHADGDILIDNMGYIHPRHLIKVEEKDESTSVGALHIDVEVGVSVTENKKHYTPKEVELRERIAIELLRQQNRHPKDIDYWFKAITGK